MNERRPAPPCPLCASGAIADQLRDDSLLYLKCSQCALIFLHPSGYLSPEQELQRYLLHQNSGDDPGYLRHLRRLAAPMLERTRTGSAGLDFGCGPTKVMAQILDAGGRQTASYDPYFYPNRGLLAARYDFITCSEVLEHVHDPAALFELFHTLLHDGGTAGFMTAFAPPPPEFAGWRYRRDPTHVCFYGEQTFRWISARLGWKLAIPEKGVAIFTVPHGGPVPGRAIIQHSETRAAG
jgi:SAM-dependent methyltransferase